MVVLRNVTQVLVKASKPINGEGHYVSEVPKDVNAAHKIHTSSQIPCYAIKVLTCVST